jgi:serine/threonine protein kinase
MKHIQGYVAPEILNGVPYDEAADMWSIGVILFILLGGYPPFIDENQRKLFRKIRKGEFEFHPEYWSTISEDAKNLICNLLTVDSSQRLSAREALNSNWIAVASDDTLDKNDMGPNLVQLRKFNGRRKFRAAVASVLAVNKLTNFLAFDVFQAGDSELPLLNSKSMKLKTSIRFDDDAYYA